MKCKSVFFSIFITCSLFGYDENYEAFCQQASQSEALFAHFKRTAAYNEVLESLCPRFGQEYLDFIIAHYPDLAMKLDQFRDNDRIGNPIQFNYGNYGLFSPTTLRYVKVAGDLLSRFGELKHLHIVEIGGGYGGQCKILSECGGFASYTIIDLPRVVGLSAKYLDLCNIQNAQVISCENLDSFDAPIDLLISNYAYLELRKEDAKRYEKLLKSSRHGYITGYFARRPELVSRLDLLSAMPPDISVQMADEVPLTGTNNQIITW
jgi:putative sugar O-methyltransferase